MTNNIMNGVTNKCAYKKVVYPIQFITHLATVAIAEFSLLV